MPTRPYRHWSDPQRLKSIERALETDHADPFVHHERWARVASRRFPNSEWEAVRWALVWIKKGHQSPPPAVLKVSDGLLSFRAGPLR